MISSFGNGCVFITSVVEYRSNKKKGGMIIYKKMFICLLVSFLVALLFLVQVFLKMEKEESETVSWKEIRENAEKEIKGEIKEEREAEDDRIRVLLKSSSYEDFYHNSLILFSRGKLVLDNGREKTKWPEEKELVIEKDSDLFLDEELRILPEEEEPRKKIYIKNLKRNVKYPGYRGELVIKRRAEGLLVVNEIPVEQYLQNVVNSEMPAEYPLEALKAQAVCARTYAMKHKKAHTLEEFGADLDDSTSFQVYGNQREQKRTNEAVKETEDEVLLHQGALADVFYFSTSCGSTASVKEIWPGLEAEYLTGKLQQVEEEKKVPVELSQEKQFQDFLRDKKIKTWDSSFPWYRWSVRLSKERILKNLEEAEGSDYWDSERKKEWEDKKETIKDIEVIKRGTGGIVLELLVKGEKESLKLTNEYEIRKILAPKEEGLKRMDQSRVRNLSLLPSAFFYIRKTGKKQEFLICGGGYGHGIGLSQNGAEKMAEAGNDYKTILMHYFTGCVVGNDR